MAGYLTSNVRALRENTGWTQAETAERADLDAKLPVLATYMGHLDILGTQHYLHLTAELFPEITSRSQAHFGDVIPRRVVS